MARGFNITVSVATADDFTDDTILAELEAHRLLSALEKVTLIPAAVASAKALCAALVDGPFIVNLNGVDHASEYDELTTIGITVTSTFTGVTSHQDAIAAADVANAVVAEDKEPEPVTWSEQAAQKINPDGSALPDEVEPVEEPVAAASSKSTPPSEPVSAPGAGIHAPAPADAEAVTTDSAPA